MRSLRIRRFGLAVAVATMILPGVGAGTIAAAATAGAASVTSAQRGVWATVDVCSASTVGIRASMPATGRAGERMRMRFHLEYRRRSRAVWHILASGDSGYVFLGSARSGTRQAGWDFRVSARAAAGYQLRGLVDFAWLHGSVVVARAEALSTAGHHAAAGAEPAGYSAARCAVT